MGREGSEIGSGEGVHLNSSHLGSGNNTGGDVVVMQHIDAPSAVRLEGWSHVMTIFLLL